MTKLDVASLCSSASTCRILRSCVACVVTFTPNFNPFNVGLPMETIRALLLPNRQLSSLKLDCVHLNNSAIDRMVRPSLPEMCLRTVVVLAGICFMKLVANSMIKGSSVWVQWRTKVVEPLAMMLWRNCYVVAPA